MYRGSKDFHKIQINTAKRNTERPIISGLLLETVWLQSMTRIK